MTTTRLRATLKAAVKGGAACELDLDLEELFGKARAAVSVSIKGYTFRTTTIVMGGRYFLGINKAHQAGAGITVGDTFWVDIRPDSEPRVVKVPPDLEARLRASPVTREAWDQLSYTRQKEHARSLTDAKKLDTRARRLGSVLERLRTKSPTSRKK